MMLGKGSYKKILYLIDFGLSRQYFDSKTATHFQKRTELPGEVNGTPEFASINCHRGSTLSRRDDLESLVYTMAYIAKGELPWIGLSNYEICQFKLGFGQSDVIKSLPSCFSTIHKYVRSLRFD
jgi:serine/threonine protein kinase